MPKYALILCMINKSAKKLADYLIMSLLDISAKHITFKVQRMSDYRRGSGVWKNPPIIGLEPFDTLAKMSTRRAHFDHVGTVRGQGAALTSQL